MKRWIFLTLLSFFTAGYPMAAQKVDPYHAGSGGYGYRLFGSDQLSAWWCEGTYKVMKNTPLPEQEGDTIRLTAFRNEYEPFQVVLNTQSVSVEAMLMLTLPKPLKHVIRTVDYVNITSPTDDYAFGGWWPDPLPEQYGSFSLYPGSNHPSYIVVYVPRGTDPGRYTGSLSIQTELESLDIPVVVTVQGIDLPSSPSLRSGFGLSVDKIIAYHNLTDSSNIRNVFDLYMQAFRDYLISPYNPFALDPIEVRIKGQSWKGGVFDSRNSFNGDYSYMIRDDDPEQTVYAEYFTNLEVFPDSDYELTWKIKSEDTDQQYCILFESYDSSGRKIVFGNRMEQFEADTTWTSGRFNIPGWHPDTRSVSLNIFPASRTPGGETKGTIWIDNIELMKSGKGDNLLKQPGFEVDIDSLSVDIDFTNFEKSGERYLDNFGFNSFRLNIEGMGSGTYFDREDGIFGGFIEGSEAYDALMNKYLSSVESFLESRGWLNKAYVYWFDEPGERDYPFVRKGMETIKNNAPGINTFLTENMPGPEISDVTDITCTIFHKVDPRVVEETISRDRQYWSYLCTAPKAPWVSEFIDHDAVNLRLWPWISYQYGMKGILIWSVNYWTSRSASPVGYLQNPWKEPASYVQGYGWPYGKQTNWGNGDGRLFYPPNRNPGKDSITYIEGPVPSLRLEILRQGIEDYEYFVILKRMAGEIDNNDPLKMEAMDLLSIPETVFKDGMNYTKDPKVLMDYRKRVSDMIIKIKNSGQTNTY